MPASTVLPSLNARAGKMRGLYDKKKPVAVRPAEGQPHPNYMAPWQARPSAASCKPTRWLSWAGLQG
jgi:hypothetical protein